MYLKEVLDKYNDKNIKLFVDMDGVIADYNVGEAHSHHLKRPLITSINKLEEVSNMENITMYILSACKKNEGIEEKHIWLDKHAPFFKKENRIIISKEQHPGEETKKLKSRALTNFEKDSEKDILLVIDDDPSILKEMQVSNPEVVLFKDTVLVD